MPRTLFSYFQTVNPIYIGATVNFYTVDGNGAKTSTLATLYEAETGADTLSNPQTLDSEGKLAQSVYIDAPVIATVSTLSAGDHDTGIQRPIQIIKEWATGTIYLTGELVFDGDSSSATYLNVYSVDATYTSDSTIAADVSNGDLTLEYPGHAVISWATEAEDTLIPTAYGGDGATDYSALHHAAKAAASATAAAASETAAATSETNSATSAAAAAASATAAAASAASNLFGTIVNVTDADSPYTITADTDDGTMFIVDTSGGDVTFVLPSIDTAGESERYGFIRESASNDVILQRDGTDTMNGVSGNYTMAQQVNELVGIFADEAGATDNWVVIPWTQADADETTLTKSGSTISVKDAGVDTVQLADDAVTPAKVAGDVNAQTGTSYTLALTDDHKVVTMDNASANTLTIPTNASVPFPTGAKIDIIMKGAGVTTVEGDTGVTVNGVSAGSGDLSQYGACSVIKTATNTWIAVGLTVS